MIGGPATAPVFPAGPLFDLLDLDQFRRGHPWTAYARLRAEAPVYWQAGRETERGFWILSRHEDVQYVSRNPELFCSSQGFKAADESFERFGPDIDAAMRRIILATDPPEHTSYRRLLQPSFTVPAARARAELIRGMVREILDRLDGRRTIEVIGDIAAELPIRVLCHLLGVPESDRHRILAWTNRMVGADDPDFNATPQSAAAAFKEVFDYGRDLLKDRRAHPGDDLISLVAHGEVDGKPLDPVATDGFFVLMVGAGNETTRNAIADSLYVLAGHPDVRGALIADPQRLPLAVEELLRFVSPVIHMRRTATRDTEIRGQRIAQGEKVVMLYGSANRDERVFGEPDSLDPGRANVRSHLAFGHGIHICLGAVFARMELQIVLEEFLRRYPDYAVAGGPTYLRSNFVHGVKSLSLALN
jgi:cholest-4-en-3-one 26-monooxygenase